MPRDDNVRGYDRSKFREDVVANENYGSSDRDNGGRFERGTDNIPEEPQRDWMPVEANLDNVAKSMANMATDLQSENNIENKDLKIDILNSDIDVKLISWEHSGLHPQIVKNLHAVNYHAPRPIQSAVIPQLLAGYDLIGQAETGGGKTCAFACPIINKILEIPEHERERQATNAAPYCIVLVPVRELAKQIYDMFQIYSKDCGIQVKLSYGQMCRRTSYQDILNGCHILVGTRGRVLDLIQKSHVKCDNLKIFVIDEADRLLEDVRQGGQHLNEIFDSPTFTRSQSHRQTLIFSATFNQNVDNIIRKLIKPIPNMNEPVRVKVSQGRLNPRVRLHFFETRGIKDKYEEVKKLLSVRRANGKAPKTFIFVDQKAITNRYSIKFNKMGVNAGSIDRSRRESSLQEFRDGIIDVLVGTDVCSRGLDIGNVERIINFDLPKSSDESAMQMLIHRVTGIGKQCDVYIFIDPSEPNDNGLISNLAELAESIGAAVPYFMKDVTSEIRKMIHGMKIINRELRLLVDKDLIKQMDIEKEELITNGMKLLFSENEPNSSNFKKFEELMMRFADNYDSSFRILNDFCEILLLKIDFDAERLFALSARFLRIFANAKLEQYLKEYQKVASIVLLKEFEFLVIEKYVYDDEAIFTIEEMTKDMEDAPVNSEAYVERLKKLAKKVVFMWRLSGMKVEEIKEDARIILKVGCTMGHLRYRFERGFEDVERFLRLGFNGELEKVFVVVKSNKEEEEEKMVEVKKVEGDDEEQEEEMEVVKKVEGDDEEQEEEMEVVQKVVEGKEEEQEEDLNTVEMVVERAEGMDEIEQEEALISELIDSFNTKWSEDFLLGFRDKKYMISTQFTPFIVSNRDGYKNNLANYLIAKSFLKISPSIFESKELMEFMLRGMVAVFDSLYEKCAENRQLLEGRKIEWQDQVLLTLYLKIFSCIEEVSKSGELVGVTKKWREFYEPTIIRFIFQFFDFVSKSTKPSPCLHGFIEALESIVKLPDRFEFFHRDFGNKLDPEWADRRLNQEIPESVKSKITEVRSSGKIFEFPKSVDIILPSSVKTFPISTFGKGLPFLQQLRLFDFDYKQVEKEKIRVRRLRGEQQQLQQVHLQQQQQAQSCSYSRNNGISSSMDTSSSSRPETTPKMPQAPTKSDIQQLFHRFNIKNLRNDGDSSAEAAHSIVQTPTMTKTTTNSEMQQAPPIYQPQIDESELVDEMSDASSRILSKELNQLQKDAPPGIIVDKEIASMNLKQWHVALVGGERTLYEGEVFTLQFTFTQNYPYVSPEVMFVGDTIPAHPHIYSNGHIRLSILSDDWTPALSVQTVCLSIMRMLSSASEKKHPVNDEIYVRTCSKIGWFHDDTV